MTKIYYCAYRNAYYKFKDVQVHFTDRCTAFEGSIYITSNLKEQEAIEASADFKNGTIRLHESYGEVEEKNNAIAVEYPEVTKVQDAVEVLKQVSAEKGVEYATIRKKEDVITKANELGVSFPNL
jgi:hypothetical protein